MASKLHILSATGSSPFSFYMCGLDLNNCNYVGSANTITSSVQFDLPTIFNGASQVILKMIDSNNCEEIKIIDCDDNCTFQVIIYDETSFPCLFD